MVTIDMTDPEERRKAVEAGYIWSAPQGAIEAALEDIAAGRIAAPQYIPAEFKGLAAEYGVTAGSAPGFAEGSGPA